jgi:DNA-binding NtrC family response regulator
MSTNLAIAPNPRKNVCVLSVSPCEKDHSFLSKVLTHSKWALCPNSKWTLCTASALAPALTLLREGEVPIVLCERDLQPGTWKEMLAQLRLLPSPPLLIVSSRLADEHLWAEALNLGAYDVLAKPFDSREVVRILSLAWLHWKERHDGFPRARHPQERDGLTEEISDVESCHSEVSRPGSDSRIAV